MIKAPYNFVPLSKQVVTPYWADYLSHDIPFADARSGVLKVTLKAHSPIFVGDGQTDQHNVQTFCQDHEGNYFIPGSSIKGMLRHVMEIMTFGKMQQVSERKFSVREFENDAVYDKSNIWKEVNAGWLYKDPNRGYLVDDCGKPGRIHQADIDESIFHLFLKGKTPHRSLNKDYHKSAKYKYDSYGSRSLEDYFGLKRESFEKKIYQRSPTGDKGTIVFTGQPGLRDESNPAKKKGKVYEFVFFAAKKQEIEVDEAVMENFRFAYFDHENSGQQSEDWKYWKPKLENGERIPIFFRYQSGTPKIKDMGLSLLYKIVYEHSVAEVIAKTQKTVPRKLDLVEAIWGTVGLDPESSAKEEKEFLRGRVHVGHAQHISGGDPGTIAKEILSSPKASYYPNYIYQPNPGGKYHTLMDDQARLAGWKRYPVRKHDVGHTEADTTVGSSGKISEKVYTRFRPLPKESVFSFKISYHNLNKVELGALISALTFHENPQSFHTLGMGKPLGYGKVKLILEGSFERAPLAYFEAFMDQELGEPWVESASIKALFTMSCEQEIPDEQLEYMPLPGFREAKKRGETLDPYHQLPGVTAKQPDSQLVSEVQREQIQQELESHQASFTRLKSFGDYLDGLYQDEAIRFAEAIEQKKKELLDQLKSRKKELSARVTVQEGPDLSRVDVSHRDALKKLSNEMKRYFQTLKQGGIDTTAHQEIFGAQLRQEHWSIVVEKVIEIVSNSNRVRTTWKRDINKSKDRNLEKIAEWIGQEEAEKLKKIIYPIILT